MTKILSQENLYSKDDMMIGVLGGTFDPPHLAHIHMAESAMEALGLNYVVFMPLGTAPHGKEGISSSEHRINMLEIILRDYNCFYIDDYEVKAEEPSYTIKSIERINGVLGENSKMYFIIGADSLMYLEKWRDAEHLMKIANFAVIPRKGYKKSDCMAHINLLEDNFGAHIVYIDSEAMSNSSTEIRRGAEEAGQITTDEVMQYIKENRLYKS